MAQEYDVDIGMYKDYDHRFKFDAPHVFMYIGIGVSDDEILYAKDMSPEYVEDGILAYYNSGKASLEELMIHYYSGGLALQDGNTTMFPVAWSIQNQSVYFYKPDALIKGGNQPGLVALCTKTMFEMLKEYMQEK